MKVLLPNDAIAKTIKGDVKVSDLVTGDEVLAYNTGDREIVFVRVTVNRVQGAWDLLSIYIQHARWISMLAQTMAYVNGGPVPVGNYPPMFVVYCPLHPGKLTPRHMADVSEKGKVHEVVELEWEPRIYLSVEGLLVGS